MAGVRQEKLAALLKKEISQIFLEDLNDPVIKSVNLLTVTDIELSPDLKIAKVFVSFFENDSQKTALAFEKLKKASSFIRRRISGKLKNLRFIPEIRLYQDATPAQASKIMKIFYQLEAEREKK